MKITIIYDNTALSSSLTADWGFSCLVECENRKILFDTGGKGAVLLNNLSALKIAPETIDDIVISHPDFDHIGGLAHMLEINETATVHLPVSFRGVKGANRVIHYDKLTEMYNNIYCTGELGEREQSLVVKTGKGIVLVIGCCHPGLDTIIKSVDHLGHIYAVIGGLHGFDDFPLLEKTEKVCPTHCTQHADEIKKLYPEKFLKGGAGQTIEL